MAINETRRPFPQLNGFRSWTSDELKRRKTTWPTPISTPFVRMTSCNEDNVNNYKYFTLGLHGFDAGDDINLFDLTYGSRRDIVGYAYRAGKKVLIGSNEIKYVPPNIEISDAQSKIVEDRIRQAQKQSDKIEAIGAHPIPGITSVQIKRSGLAAPLIAEVTWQCYNQQQLEFLRNHFLVVGSYIVLEWGHKYHDDFRRNKQLLDFNDSENVMSDLLQSVVKGRRYVIDKFAEQNNGNYDFIVGQIGNFTVNLDPATNIYKCSSRIVSLGENVWGLSTNQTVTVINNTDTTSVNRLTDIHSYFEGRGCAFDTLLGKLSSDANGVKYCRPQQPPMNNNAYTAAQTGVVSPNPHDAAFISWSAFTNDIINDIIEMLDKSSVDQNTRDMYNKLRGELSSLLGLGGPPANNTGLPEDVFAQQNELYEQEFIGNHKYLRSVDPEALIIITSEIARNNPGVEWLGNGIFGDGNEEHGKLINGIWINAEMIRESFLNTTTLQAAIQQILNRMNVASGNYWQLRLFYDDEISVYKVIDYKFDHELSNLKFYVFNSHTNEHHNETVDIKFDSAFPPELVTQMMVVSMIQTSSPEEQKNLFNRYPLINNTSPFMFAVNWTSLRDILKEQIKTYRNAQSTPLGTSRKVNSTGVQANETNNVSVSARTNVETGKGPQTANTPTQAGTAGVPRTVNGGFFALPNISNEASSPLPRTTVLPTSKDNAFVLDSFPVTSIPLVITSNFGARNGSDVPGMSKNHKGVDIRAPQDTPIRAVKAGKVNGLNTNSTTAGGMIVLGHGNGFETRYLHLSKIVVSTGEFVQAGEIIGYSGGTPGTANAGNSSGPHLHFEILKNGIPVNPRDSLMTRGVSPLMSSAIEVAADTSTPVVINATNSPFGNVNTPSESGQQDIEEQYKVKFGNNILNLIYPAVSILRNKITQDGYANLSNNIVNAFISPFPTKTSVELRVPGISGISISDGFMVDKLPFIFANYGVFQVTELTDSITDKGWYTTIRGFFKMIWPDGRGGQRDE